VGERAGKIRKLVSWATGDRRDEARGLAEAEKGERPTEAEVDAAEERVRDEWDDQSHKHPRGTSPAT
jgi:hypothetical protein